VGCLRHHKLSAPIAPKFCCYPQRRQSQGHGFHRSLSVCRFFCMISQKPMLPRSPNLTQKCSTRSPGNPLILGSKCERSRSHCWHRSVHSCECWLLLPAILVVVVAARNVLSAWLILMSATKWARHSFAPKTMHKVRSSESRQEDI